MDYKINEHPEIKGWAIDADPENDPTYPMKTHIPEEHGGYNWERPKQQPIEYEVLHSTERFNVTAVYGTSVPPNGLSGAIRKLAFKYSEGTYAHWIGLLIADRINVIEGEVHDLSQGRIPNIFAERGFRASWKYNKKGVINSVLSRLALGAGILALVYRKEILRKAKEYKLVS